jgi:8-oxo-dGTP pyrophosphatase MutT (NUDIX family)
MANWIQDHILEQLIRHKTRRYTELKPRDIEGNLFMYHLKGLLREGIVEKDEKVYKLSLKGMQHVATISLRTGRVRKQPVILNVIIARNEKGEYLFSKWHRQPNTGLISFPHGMMHYGEPIFESVKRELAEKAGLEADLTYKGNVHIRVFRDKEIERHMLVQLFKADNLRAGRADELRPDVAESFWARIDDLRPEVFIPGFYELVQMAEGASNVLPEDIQVYINPSSV